MTVNLRQVSGDLIVGRAFCHGGASPGTHREGVFFIPSRVFPFSSLPSSWSNPPYQNGKIRESRKFSLDLIAVTQLYSLWTWQVFKANVFPSVCFYRLFRDDPLPQPHIPTSTPACSSDHWGPFSSVVLFMQTMHCLFFGSSFTPSSSQGI